MNRAGTVCECYGGPDQRLVQPWVGKLRHSRELCDDWGFIRDESGKLIITVPVTVPHEEWAEHRRNNTDPTQPIVDAILDALNGPNKELTDRACEVRSSGS
jgi:hypothetical protein